MVVWVQRTCLGNPGRAIAETACIGQAKAVEMQWGGEMQWGERQLLHQLPHRLHGE